MRKTKIYHNKLAEPLWEHFRYFAPSDKHNYRNSIHEIRDEWVGEGSINPILPRNLI